MRKLRNPILVRNHQDLPLFHFAALRHMEHLNLAERYVRSRIGLSSPSTVRLIAELAGFNGEG